MRCSFLVLRSPLVGADPSQGNFGFIEFEDRKEAKDAMLHIHGMKFGGERLGVDVSYK